MNLLIALMSNIMSDLQKDRTSSWKCHWIKVGLQFCNEGVVLPPPMNLLDAIITLPVICCKWKDNSVVEVIELIIKSTTYSAGVKDINEIVC